MEIVELLLQVHANIDIQTDVGTLLHQLLTSCCFQIKAFILYNQDGWTALHLAAEKGHPNIVKLLVRRGANVSLKDKVRNHSAAFIASILLMKHVVNCSYKYLENIFCVQGGVAAARYTSNPEIIQEIATAQSNDDQDSARSSSTMLPQLNRTALDLSKGTSIQDGTDSSAQNNFSVVEQPEEPEPDEPKPASVPPECSDAISLLPESSLQEQYLDQHSQYTHQDDADGQQETGVMTRAKQQYEDRVVMETISLEEEEVLVSTVPSASAASVETNQCCVVS